MRIWDHLAAGPDTIIHQSHSGSEHAFTVFPTPSSCRLSAAAAEKTDRRVRLTFTFVTDQHEPHCARGRTTPAPQLADHRDVDAHRHVERLGRVGLELVGGTM